MKKAPILTIIALFVSLLAGCGTPAPTINPPPDRNEVITVRPGPNFIWISGHWKWSHGRYLWEPGHWEKIRKGRNWVAGRWEKRGSNWVWIQGRWKRR